MKIIYIILASLFLSGISSEKLCAANDIRSRIIGKWEVGLPYLPGPPNQSFILDVREKDNRIIFDVLNGGLDVGDIDVQEMRFTYKNGKLSANLYVGELAILLIWEEKGVMRGSIETSLIGVLPLILTKL